MDVIDEFQNPKYTGENRCTPCTVLNVAIASVISLVLAAVNIPLAVGSAIIMLLAIYLRGYLVPGTPTITKRYFPDRILRYFDHGVETETDADFDPEELLLRAGAVTEIDGGQDLALTPDFETAWFDRYEAVQEVAIDTDLLASLVDFEADRLSIEWRGDAFVAWLDDQWIGQWESRVAFLADVAANDLLEQRLREWETLPLSQQSNALGVLRFFLERCPACDGDVVLETELKQSCCREIDVIATTCQGCGERLFEAEYDPEAMAELDGETAAGQ